MGVHDDYGKAVLRLADDTVDLHGPAVAIELGDGGIARIDGALRREVAIEVESRTAKQVRGAILDLLLHAAPKKLLILVPKHMQNPAACREHCSNILRRFVLDHDYRVVLLEGTGEAQRLEPDAVIVRQALAELQAETAG